MPATTAKPRKTKRPSRAEKGLGPRIKVPKGYVLVSVKQLEDLYDIAAIRRGKRERTLPLEVVLTQLRDDGRL